jgi:hypothetical protein
MGTIALAIIVVFIIVAVILLRRASRGPAGSRAPRPALERERTREEAGPPKTGETIDAYLSKLPVTPGESQFLAKLKTENEEYNAHRSNTYYDVLTGTASEVRSKILHEVTSTYTRHQDEVWRMVTEGKTSCFYRWGVNAYGAQVYRFGEDRFAYVHVSVMSDA